MNDLITTAAEDTKRQAAKLAELDPKNITQVAAVLEVPVSEAEAFMTANGAEIEAAVALAELTGTANTAKAIRAVSKLLDILLAKLGDGSALDISEVHDLMKQPLRIIEARDRLRLAEKEKVDRLPVFNFIFHSHGGGLSVTATPDADADVIDIAPRGSGGDV